MDTLFRPLDRLLNKITMFKVVLFSLVGLFYASVILALFGSIGVSAVGIVLSTVILLTTCLVANQLMARLFNAPTNHESWMITAMILVFIVPPVDSVSRGLLVALCGFIAIASKFVITWRGSHVFNPAAAGAFVVSVFGLLPIIWWVATPALLPFMALLAIVILRKQREFSLFAIFALVAVAVLLLQGVFINQLSTMDVLRNALLSWPLIYLGSVMLTEPLTMPKTREYKLIFAALVGAVFAAQLQLGPISTSPHVALLVGNVFALLVTPPFGAKLKVLQTRYIAPNIYELQLQKHSRMKFSPGQYVEVTLPHSKPDLRGNRRTLSIASAPHEDTLRLTVRTYSKPSSFKRKLISLQPGKFVRVANVAGSFTFDRAKGKPVLLIAGGIGITPFRSMVSALISTGKQRDIVLVYVASDAKHFVYKALFTKAAAISLKTHYVTGRVSGDEIAKLVPDIAKRHVYISGPDAMVRGYKATLLSQGANRKHIETDHFSGY